MYKKITFLFSSAKKNALFIDSSTIDPSVSETVAQEAEKRNIRFIDGPVSGGKFIYL